MDTAAIITVALALGGAAITAGRLIWIAREKRQQAERVAKEDRHAREKEAETRERLAEARLGFDREESTGQYLLRRAEIDAGEIERLRGLVEILRTWQREYLEKEAAREIEWSRKLDDCEQRSAELQDRVTKLEAALFRAGVSIGSTNPPPSTPPAGSG